MSDSYKIYDRAKVQKFITKAAALAKQLDMNKFEVAKACGYLKTTAITQMVTAAGDEARKEQYDHIENIVDKQ